MNVQEDLEFYFAPALAAQPDVRPAGSTEGMAAAAGLKQAAMLKQIFSFHRY